MSGFSGVKNILVIKLRHIGDVLLTTPVFRALKENFPTARVAALVNHGTRGVLVGNPNVDKIIVPPAKWGHFFRRMRAEIEFFRQIREEKFDMAISLTSGDRAAIAALFSGARYRLAHDPGRSGLRGKRFMYTHVAAKCHEGHKVMRNLDLLKKFGIKAEDPKVEIFVSGEAREAVGRRFMEHGIGRSDRVVHIHPGSKGAFKCWQDEKMAEVIRWLDAQGVYAVISASSDREDTAKARKILAMLPDGVRQRVLDLSGKLTLTELAAVSEASDVFFGVDSGPMHIAAAVGTPVVAIFGSGEKSWAPWGEGHRVLVHRLGERGDMDRREYIKRNVESVTVREVEDAIAAALSKACKPKEHAAVK